MTIEYDGSSFHGWQEQPGLKTVQGDIQEALAKVTGVEVSVSGTSRTDAGVHALGQCCNFKGDFGIPVENMKKAVNNILSGGRTGGGTTPGEIRIVDLKEVPEDFHARFNCKGKTYRYVINQGEMDVFRRNYCYFIDSGNANSSDETSGDIEANENPNNGLDIEKMREAAKYIVGAHDFACFQSTGGNPKESTVRTVFDLRILDNSEEGPEIPYMPLVNGMDVSNLAEHNWHQGDILFEVTGDGFLYNMVRIIVGTLVEVGQGRRTPESVKEAIDRCDRTLAGHTAPPTGLYLAKIYF